MRNKYKHKLKRYLDTYKIPYTRTLDSKRRIIIDLADLKDTHRTWIFNFMHKINGK